MVHKTLDTEHVIYTHVYTQPYYECKQNPPIPSIGFSSNWVQAKL